MTEEFLEHYGTLHKSGRYPWGSGDTPEQRNTSFLNYVDGLQKQGMSQTEIAKGVGMSTTQLRAATSIAKNEQRKSDSSMALRLKDKGMSNVAIGERMGRNESSVRSLLDPATRERNDILVSTSNMLKEQVAKKGYLDIGAGTENHIGISQTKLSTAAAILQEEGYRVDRIKVQQLGTGKYTTVKVLSPPGTTFRELVTNADKIKSISDYTEDNGRSFLGIETPVNVDSKRVGIRYAEDGGANRDGIIQLRRNVSDISLGNARYAQVRIAVDGTHFLKGMAMYADDLPAGTDLIFNTNKSNTGDKHDAMKPMKSDVDNQFGSIVRQKHYIGADGKEHLSALNIVGTENPNGDSTTGEEGGWYNWSRNLSSQMMSKQSPALAKQQLDMAFEAKKSEFDNINSLTNPAIKKKLLEKFADGADSSAVHLKAAALPRTRAHVILPINSLKDNEIFAPNYRNGERVVLIRHPHGGIFEIPELTVNNRNKEAISLINQAVDAVGINSKVAERLSGADFDGDTVLVIPNINYQVNHSSQLEGLKGFDPKTSYPAYEGMPPMKSKQREMGDISNLITDMTIKGAQTSEIARAVRHSMVVIDAEKHNLNYKQSAIDNGIKDLKTIYQGRSNAGASTLVSKASSTERVAMRKARPSSEGGPIDVNTGKKMYVPTGETYTKTTVNKKTGDITTENVPSKFKSTKMAETADAFTLSSGTPMETVYATHANKLKALGNEARKVAASTPNHVSSPSAKLTYAPQVSSLSAKLNLALKNQPLERQAHLLGNAVVSAKKQANPDITADDVKKIKGQALAQARLRTGAKKQQIDITQAEWDAIQAGAVSNNVLTKILNNTDLDRIKELATPKEHLTMTTSVIARAQTMVASGYTQAEIADALGVSVSTLNKSLNGKES